MGERPKPDIVRLLGWILDGHVLGEYDIYECGARMSRAVAAHMGEVGGRE